MKIPTFINQILAHIFGIKWQIIAVASIALLCLALAFNIEKNSFIPLNIPKENMARYLWALLPLLGLTFTISSGYLLNFIHFTTTRKNDLYAKFKSEVIALFKYLEDKKIDSPLINEAEAALWEINKKELNDFPFDDWGKMISGFMSELNKDQSSPEDANLGKKIVVRIGYLEELHNEVSVMCVRQWITGVYIRPVFKAFIICSAYS